MSTHSGPAKSFEDSLSLDFLQLNSQSDDDDISQEQEFIYGDSFNTCGEINSTAVRAIRTKQFIRYGNNTNLTQKTPSDIKWAKKENPRQHKMNHSERQQILKDLQELKSQIYKTTEDENNNKIVELKNIKEQVLTANLRHFSKGYSPSTCMKEIISKQ